MSRRSVPAQDHTGEPLLGPLSDATVMPDGKSVAAYNEAHGRRSDSPVSGGPMERKSKGNYLTNSRNKKTDVRTLG